MSQDHFRATSAAWFMLGGMAVYIIPLHIANALLCFLLAAHLFAFPSLRPTPKRLLGLSYLLYGHQSIALIAILSGHGQVFSVLRPLIAMLLGPAVHCYFSCVRRQDAVLRPIDGLHFLFGMLVFACLYLVHSVRGLIDLAIPASFVIYFLLILKDWRGSAGKLAHLGDYTQAAQRWLLCLIVMAFINIALEIAVTFELQHGVALGDSQSLFAASIAFLTLNSITMLAALYRSDWLEWMYQFGHRVVPGLPPGTDEVTLKHLFARWETLVKTENLHKQEFGITLAQAAKKLRVPARQLSNATNHVYGSSFSVYLNDLRIKEACHLLLTEPTMAIIDAMQASGFSSKSNFNKEFLRVLGMSPSQYRQSQQDAKP